MMDETAVRIPLPFQIDRTLYEPRLISGSSIHIAGLGDVGGTLVSGLRLMGGECLSKIGLFDLDVKKVERWRMEAGQIFLAESQSFPEVVSVSEKELFNCDIFAFCVTAGVPPMDFQGDVRMYQLEKNLAILRSYIKKAVEAKFRGLIAVISDPVDHLCLGALKEAEKLSGEDGFRLSPLQIRGFGLGVMYARALYYAKEMGFGDSFLREGRAYGPHGEGLIIADSLDAYDAERSQVLTEKTRSANLRVRELGYKPYIAPAFSSACLSLLAVISEEWHYSAVYLEGAYFGIKNKTSPKGTILDTELLPLPLVNQLQQLHKDLATYYEKSRT